MNDQPMFVLHDTRIAIIALLLNLTLLEGTIYLLLMYAETEPNQWNVIFIGSTLFFYALKMFKALLIAMNYCELYENIFDCDHPILPYHLIRICDIISAGIPFIFMIITLGTSNYVIPLSVLQYATICYSILFCLIAYIAGILFLRSYVRRHRVHSWHSEPEFHQSHLENIFEPRP